MNIAVIPARGGSKRIPRKNVKVFCGKPMIAWSIAAARNSGCFDRIIVSTDDEEIAEVAQAWGAEAPFRRPRELADDFTPTVPVIAHAVRWQQAQATVTKVCCIYATAPFLQPEDLQLGLEVLERENCDYTLAVASYPFPIQRALRLGDSNRISMFQPEHLETRSQDLDEAFHDAGQFYWGTTQAWADERAIFGPSTIGLPIARKRVQDIDTTEDWERAELLFRILNKRTDGGDVA